MLHVLPKNLCKYFDAAGLVSFNNGAVPRFIFPVYILVCVHSFLHHALVVVMPELVKET
jgi:hypothetical protein